MGQDVRQHTLQQLRRFHLGQSLQLHAFFAELDQRLLFRNRQRGKARGVFRQNLLGQIQIIGCVAGHFVLDVSADGLQRAVVSLQQFFLLSRKLRLTVRGLFPFLRGGLRLSILLQIFRREKQLLERRAAICALIPLAASSAFNTFASSSSSTTCKVPKTTGSPGKRSPKS